MQNVAPSGALARRSRQWLQLAFLIVTGGAFVGVIGLALLGIPFVDESSSFYGFYRFIGTLLLVGGAGFALGGIGLAIRAYLTRIDNDLALITGQHLSKFLDQRFWLVRNINKRGLGYIDAVLVGPPGALVFRIVDKAGIYANEKGNWLARNPQGEWLPWRLNPTDEAIVDIKALREYLALNRVAETPVFGVVVFTQEAPAIQVVARDPVVPVAQPSDLMKQLQDNYLAQDRIDPAQIKRIVDLIYDS